MLVVQYFLGPDLDVTGLTAGAAAGLVQHDGGMGQGGPVALGAGAEDHGGSPHRLAYADGVYRWLDITEGIGNGEGFGFKTDGISGIPACTSGIDIKENRFFWIIEFQIQQLGNDEFGDINAHLPLGIVIAEKG